MRRLSGLIAAALLASAAVSAAPAWAATKIIFLHNASAAFVAAYVAKDQGYFAKRGLDFELSLAQSGAVMPPALLSNSAQIGAPTPTVLINAVLQGIDLVAIAGTEVYPTTAATAGVIARNGSGIKSPRDLEGHKVGLPSLGGIFEVLMRNWVRANGGDDQKVHWVEVQIREMGDALKEGLVDAVVPVEPFYSRVLASKIGHTVGDFQSTVPAGTTPVVYAATKSWIKANPQALEAFRDSLDEAVAYIADPSHAASVRASIARYTKLPPAAAATLGIPTNIQNHIKPSALAFWIKAMHEQGLIKATPDPASLVWPWPK